MEEICYDYLRANKAREMMKCHKPGLTKKNELYVVCVSNATVLPCKRFEGDALLFGRGGVVDENGEYLSISGIPERFFGSYETNDIGKSDMKVVFCGYLVKHWGHFLIEAVTRLWYFLKNDASVDRYVFVTDDGEDTVTSGNYAEFFELLGISDKLLILNRPCIFREVIIPEASFRRTEFYSEEYNRIFDTVALTALNKCPAQDSGKLYLSRYHLKKARECELGLDLLENYFINNGYTIIYPEEYSLSQLIVLLRNSESCAFPSGSIAHNSLFCSDGQRISIFERHAIVNEIQCDIDTIKSLKVTYIDSHYMPYPVPMGGGPCMYAWTEQYEEYCKDMGEIPISDSYLSTKWIKKTLRAYYKTYYNNYNKSLGFEGEWMMDHAKCLYESYEDSIRAFGDYMLGRKPLLPVEYFSKRGIKYIIKSIIRR